MATSPRGIAFLTFRQDWIGTPTRLIFRGNSKLLWARKHSVAMILPGVKKTIRENKESDNYLLYAALCQRLIGGSVNPFFSLGVSSSEVLDGVERPIGIEPTPEPWQGSVLPLY